MRRRGPGLIGAAARTAVVAGTATSVSGRVARRQAAKFQQEQAAAPSLEQAPQAAPPPIEEAAAAPAGGLPVEQLQQLASLRDQGILTEEEFAAKKQKLLGL
jgi:hypothetical protein